MPFAVGDRVVVNEHYRGAGCNHGAIGYYGHVVDFGRAGSQVMMYVSLEGHITQKLPADDYYLRTDPFPLYEFEIEHAD